MAIVCQVSGPPGSGKSRSVKGLADKYPGEIYYINADKKPLTWAGWRSTFSVEKKNYYETSDAHEIMNILRGISKQKPEVKAVIVDTINTIMNDKEMEEMGRSGYDEICRIKTSLIAGISLRSIHHSIILK